MNRLVIALLLLFSFSHLKSDADTNYSLDTLPKFQARLVVSFNSICCGIDAKMHTKFTRFLKKNDNITYSKIYWGKEGEIDYCFKLGELSTEEQNKFVKKVKKTLGTNSRLITIQENINCPR